MMAFTAIGDLAKGYALRARNATLHKQLDRLATEVSTGRAADPVDRLGGHLSFLSQIEHDLARYASFGAGARELSILAGTMQQSLKRVGEVSEALVGSLALVGSAGGTIGRSVVAAEARGALDSAVSALNASAAGRHLFAGVAVDVAPLAPAAELLSALRSEVASATTLSGVLAAADSFFDGAGAGFESQIYQGSDTGLAAVELGNGESAHLDLRADHPAFRATLRNLALVALADDPALSLADAGRNALLDEAMNGLLTARQDQTAIQADLGYAEERIAQAQTRLETEMSALELTRNQLLEVDPYEAATELEAARNQLETLYSVTARLSRLSLVSFLS